MTDHADAVGSVAARDEIQHKIPGIARDADVAASFTTLTIASPRQQLRQRS
jgi:hypothetical protein